MAFADHYNRTMFDAQISSRTSGRQIDRETIEAVEAHLDDVAASGRMTPIMGLRGRRIRAADAWNAHLGGPKAEFRRALAQKLSLLPRLVALSTRFLRHDGDRDRPLDETEADRAYAMLCKILDDGDLESRPGQPILDDLEDSRTGDRMRIEVSGWKPRLLRLSVEDGYDWVPAADVRPLPLAAESFEVPTGRLLLSDFVRVPGISEAVDSDEEDIASDSGQLATVKALAAKHDMAYCQTTNTSISAFRVPATGAIALYDRFDPRTRGEFSPEGLEPIGTFGCGVWRITALDVSVAKRLARAGGNADSDAEVERHLALATKPDVWTGTGNWNKIRSAHAEQCHSRNVLRIDVPAGRWRIHCGSGFSKRANRRRFDLPRGGRLWAVLEHCA